MDKLLYFINPAVPAVLPADIMETGRTMDHHVAMTVGEFGDGNMERLLNRLNQFAAKHGKDKVRIHEVASRHVGSLTAFRFVAAPCFRTWCVGNGAQGVSIDYALPKNAGTVPPIAPNGTDKPEQLPIKRMRYSHFACNVVHEDLAFSAGADVHHAKHDLKRTIEKECHGKLPAEHGHGTEYIAPADTQERWITMDPLNVLNPGVGGLSEKFRYE